MRAQVSQARMKYSAFHFIVASIDSHRDAASATLFNVKWILRMGDIVRTDTVIARLLHLLIRAVKRKGMIMVRYIIRLVFVRIGRLLRIL